MAWETFISGTSRWGPIQAESVTAGRKLPRYFPKPTATAAMVPHSITTKKVQP